MVKTGSNLTSQAINGYVANKFTFVSQPMSLLCTNTEIEPVQHSLNTVVDVDYVDSIHMKKQKYV